MYYFPFNIKWCNYVRFRLICYVSHLIKPEVDFTFNNNKSLHNIIYF